MVGDCMVEIKAKRELDPEDYMQTLAHLKASGYKVGFFIVMLQGMFRGHLDAE